MSLFKKKKKHLETTTMDYGVRMITVSKSGSANTEQFNTIRTNIEFSSADEQFKSIMLTSSMASEASRPLRPTWPFRLLVKARKRC